MSPKPLCRELTHPLAEANGNVCGAEFRVENVFLIAVNIAVGFSQRFKMKKIPWFWRYFCLLKIGLEM